MEMMMTAQFRNLVFEGGGVQLNYPVKLFDRQRYIDPDDEG
jgi:NTE family protein